MNFIKPYCFFFLLLICYLPSSAQENKLMQADEKDSLEKVYTDQIKILKDQFRTLAGTRGMSPLEIDETINNLDRTIAISDYNDLAKAFGNLYSSQKEIAIILYFYNNNNLERILFEPGSIKEDTVFKIAEDSLLEINSDIHGALDLYSLSASRAPGIRGVSLKNKSESSKPDLNAIINKATSLLIPKAFNEHYKHLIIIPALNIGSIPFYLLKPYKDGSYLIDKCSITIAPSCIDLILLRAKILKKYNPDFRFVDFSAPLGYNDFESFSFTLENPLFICNPSYPTNTKYFFPELPGAKKEITNALEYASKYVLLEGDSANKKNVTKDLRDCDVAYFATHGVASETQPMDSSFLVLSGNQEPFLTAKDIMNLRPTSEGDTLHFPEMVILSACQTGLGRSMEAGIAGLARSFLIAGANHVIMSLWNVDDEATAYLMNRFIFHLQQGNMFMPSEPLRLAILDTKEKFPDPVKWASFSLFGVDY